MSVSAGYPAEGESIGPYRIVRRIGGGGMGVVFEADDESLNRKVALKVISPHLAENDDFRARFTREAQAQASLDSSHVVHVYAHGVDDGCLYIAAQLIPDGDLGQMLASYGAPPVRVGLDVMAQVAEGLADAHAVGLIHRDIKPANVLLRRRENSVQAYLGDFGIARQVGAEHTHTGTSTIGTPSYMAPELHTGGKAGVETDVYSLGCLLWATLSGRAPYAGTSEYQIVTAHLEQPIPQLPEDGPLATEINRILRTAMAKDPAERYRSAVDLRDDLRQARTLPDTATPVEKGAAAPARSTRRPAGVLAAGIALLAGPRCVRCRLLHLDQRRRRRRPGRAEHRPDLVGLHVPERADLTHDLERTEGASTAPSGSDEEVAIASLAQALDEDGGMSAAQADCMAERWVQDAGLQEMADAGFFDADYNYVDQDRSLMTPEIEAAASSAALACATAT